MRIVRVAVIEVTANKDFEGQSAPSYWPIMYLSSIVRETISSRLLVRSKSSRPQDFKTEISDGGDDGPKLPHSGT